MDYVLISQQEYKTLKDSCSVIDCVANNLNSIILHKSPVGFIKLSKKDYNLLKRLSFERVIL